VSALLTAAPAHLADHSLGGRLAQALAQRWPQSVGQIILISISAVLRKRRGWLWENIQGLRDPTDPEGAFIRQWCSGAVPMASKCSMLLRRCKPWKCWVLKVWLGNLDYRRRN
jgi:pimeloyl-ACP methyl ester carboxylesterase